MKKSTKAALLSGLVFPGIGHMYLKRYFHGMILFAGAASAIYFSVSAAVETALEVAEIIQSGNVPLDVGAITDLVSQHPSSREQSANFSMIAFVAFWLIGVVDSYRQGRAREKIEDVTGEKVT